ncbi:unnamed protein product [Cylindrotheca closterium]|uniref:guanylate cyclase n=1 Tax=Cylindrotheca closterium TaxID=2856 RepID=A0AAD2FWY6_9STRA|nr:unnamed protein product [Cylindrotheca closterium]
MYGLAFEIFEAWIVDDYGSDAWRSTKKKARCEVEAFLTRATYDFKLLVKLIKAASLYLDKATDKILRSFGNYTVSYLFNSVYGSILRNNGATLKQWLSNINATFDHFQRSFPKGDGSSPPVFWCEDYKEEKGAILLHYYNPRGNAFVPFVVGVVEELATLHFELDIKMEILGLQNSGDAQYSTWMIKAADPKDSWKVTPSAPNRRGGMTRKLSFAQLDEMPDEPCPFTADTQVVPANNTGSEEALSVKRLKHVFPFHVVVNRDFCITQVGYKLPQVLRTDQADICGKHIKDVFKVILPEMAFDWEWSSMNRFWDQSFFLEPIVDAVKTSQNAKIDFKASLLTLSSQLVMISLRPNVRDIESLQETGLTLSELSDVTSERDAVFLGEYVSREAGKTHALDKLSKDLKAEQKLSETLLYNMLPKNVADDLRQGKTVEPRYFGNVTLFFSDIEGFTTLCDQIQPWDVIDMMNQLYSVMDFLVDRFKLYKVETVGDAYVCASGLPEADEFHGEKIANFALAVVECSKHVKSPLTGEPIKLRIGIHTGHCTAGVVGTLTPHYCLFGDMVNFTARHETSGAAGRIHCSNDLYELLRSRSPAGAQQYRFKARGLVDMKGKGEHLTHWLEKGTENNHFANPGSLLTLSNKVRKRISAKKWKMRKYFQEQAANFDESNRASSASVSVGSGLSVVSSVASGAASVDSRTSFVETAVRKNSQVDGQEETIIDFGDHLPKHAQEWRELRYDSMVSQEELVDHVFEILFSTLKKCIDKGGRRLKVIEDQLRAYVYSIVGLYNPDSIYHTLRYSAEVMLRAAFLMERRAEVRKKDPWDVFMIVFAIFVRDIHHNEISDEQLEQENHYYVSHYKGKGAYHQRRSLDSALEILEDDFVQLYDEIFLGCPTFRRGVKKLAVVSVAVEVESKFKVMLERFDSNKEKPNVRVRSTHGESDPVLEMIVAFATVGHYCQSHDLFLHWNHLQLMAQLHCFEHDRKLADPRKDWHREQCMVFQNTIEPLVGRMETLLPQNTWLRFTCTNNLALWMRDGREEISSSLIPQAKVKAQPWAYNSDLVSSNLNILESLMLDIAANRAEDGTVGEVDWDSMKKTRTPYEEMRLSLEVNKGGNEQQSEESGADDLVPTRVLEELRDFVLSVANSHGRNEFRNFHHASHVAHIAHLLVQSLQKHSDEEHPVAFDPLVRFAIVLSALVHDIGHTGVSNARLKVENPQLAEKYSNKSISEQNAVDTAWNIFMADEHQNLREFLFGSSVAECKRLRELMVNGVMATDLSDPVLKALRKRRWTKASSDANTKSTLIMEHILQVSSVGHHFQEWGIFLDWNEREFLEDFLAFLEGRISEDPSDGWHAKQLKKFDDIVLPMSERGAETDCWHMLGDQLFQQATMNRLKWELEGEEFCRAMAEKTKSKFSKPSDATATTAAESMLTSTIVEQIESLSKVIKRYERKVETACGNLITVAYKDSPDIAASGLRKQSWADIRRHFRQQGWYRVHSPSLEDDELSGLTDESGNKMARRHSVDVVFNC